jgi:glycosyltransferase involved in cell wall biosynthesis
MGAGGYVIAVASLGDYRSEVVEELHRRLGEDLAIFAGAPAYDPSIRLLDYERSNVVALRNQYVPPNLLIQSIPLGKLLRARSLIMDLNPRVPHVWLVTALRRLVGRRTMLWGHAWSKGGTGSPSEKLRGALRRLATGVVTYTEEQAKALRAVHPGKPIIAAPNALYRSNQMNFDADTRRFRVLFVGRLVDEKKPAVLLQAFLRMAERLPDLVLTFVGDGPARAGLEAAARSSAHPGRIIFLGYISDFERLRPIYSETIVSVSPGYVGLSITQSLAFGVPMLVSEYETHSPEIEAVRVGFNARFFETDNLDALADALVLFSDEAKVWAARGEAIAQDCRERYSSERMARGLIEALRGD